MRTALLIIMICAGATVVAVANDPDPTELQLASVIDEPLRKFKKSPLQKLSWDAGISIGGGLKASRIGTAFGTGIPLGSFDNILVVEPNLQIDLLDTDNVLDVPDELYDIGATFFWRRQLNDRWGAMTIVAPSVQSDLVATDNSFRVFALGLLTYEWVPDRLRLSGGAVALGRADLPILPAFGLTWTPGPRWRADINFPRPKISYRLLKNGATSETWLYLQGGLGGGTWAVANDNGTEDTMSFRELQLVVGCEHLLDGGSRLFLDSGFAFGRKIEFERQGTVLDFGESFLVNSGIQW